MGRPNRADRRDVAVRARCLTAAAAFAAALFPLTGCTRPPEIQEAWNSYVEAQAAYDGCRAHRPQHCDLERAAFEASRERYRAAVDRR
jgi:hypothetical protein